MRVKNKRTAKDKSYYIFRALYLIGFLGAGIIGVLGNSFFAHEEFNSLWANIFYLLFLSLIYVTAFVSELHELHKPRDIVFHAFAFLGCLLMMLLMLVFGGVFVLLAEIYSAIMLGTIAIGFALKVRNRESAYNSFEADIKPAVSAMSLILFAMVRLLSIKFVNEMYMVWALIPAAVIFIIASAIAFVLMKDYLQKIHPSKVKRILQSAGVGCCIFIAAFAYSYTVMGTINCVFDGEPTPSQYSVIDKKIISGARSVTQFEIEVSIDGKKVRISISTEEYYSLEIGDIVTLNYYKGALGFAYWQYSDNGGGK